MKAQYVNEHTDQHGLEFWDRTESLQSLGLLGLPCLRAAAKSAAEQLPALGPAPRLISSYKYSKSNALRLHCFRAIVAIWKYAAIVHTSALTAACLVAAPSAHRSTVARVRAGSCARSKCRFTGCVFG